MGTTAMFALAAVQGYAAYDQGQQAKSARKLAEENAAKERAALAELQGEPAPVLPGVDDASVKAARRRSISDQIRRRGRASTILTGDDALGS